MIKVFLKIIFALFFLLLGITLSLSIQSFAESNGYIAGKYGKYCYNTDRVHGNVVYVLNFSSMKACEETGRIPKIY